MISAMSEHWEILAESHNPIVWDLPTCAPRLLQILGLPAAFLDVAACLIVMPTKLRCQILQEVTRHLLMLSRQ